MGWCADGWRCADCRLVLSTAVEVRRAVLDWDDGWDPADVKVGGSGLVFTVWAPGVDGEVLMGPVTVQGLRLWLAGQVGPVSK
jgi:hypothetical protein